MKTLPLLAFGPLAALLTPALAAAETPEKSRLPDEITIIGSREQARELPGSAWVIEPADLATFQYTDINRVLAQAPGVYAVQEEGLGLRPNIGIRGSGTERSGKITLMEDGILIAPAPYADPSAYHFPTTGRVNSIEVLKGAPLLREGPYTVGGAINLLSTPINDDFGGFATGEVGSFDETRLHAGIGDSGETFGWLLETHQQQNEGFQDIDRSGADSGLRKQDYVAKLRLNTPDGFGGPYQQLDLKLAYAEEQSDSSYLGLSDADFAADPLRRYGLTELDEMDNDWRGGSLGYSVAFTDNLSWNITGYYNRFERDWFKADRINGASLSSTIAAANTGDATAIAQLDGTADASIDVKHNARRYWSRGVQSSLEWDTATGGFTHSLQIGGRVHRDDIDRYQPVEKYDQINGELVFNNEVAPTGSNNREEQARAYSAWLMDTLGVTDTVDVTLALRYEDITTARTEYATPDRDVLAPADKQRYNSVREWLPGAGVTWQATDNWQLLAGVHKGMAPPGAGAKQDTDPEISLNYEAGFRNQFGGFNTEVIGFYSDYENSVRVCSVAFPCGNGSDSGTEQLGEAVIKGIEVAAGYTANWAGLSWPLQLSYTFTDAEITSASDDGSVQPGDAYPYIPRNQFFLGAGVESRSGWSVNAAGRYVSEMCIDFECERAGSDNTFRKTEDLFVLDLAAGYNVSDALRLYTRMDNVFDENAIVSRSPAGARVNKPRAAIVGFTVTL